MVLTEYFISASYEEADFSANAEKRASFVPWKYQCFHSVRVVRHLQ